MPSTIRDHGHAVVHYVAVNLNRRVDDKVKLACSWTEAVPNGSVIGR
jgi:hypothetical protein